MFELQKEEWTFYTIVNPRRKRQTAPIIEDDEFIRKSIEAFDSFLDYLKFDIALVKSWIQNNCHKKCTLSIYVDVIRDIVDSNSTYPIVFQKSYLLYNQDFRQKLCDYYNKNGITLIGPVRNNFHWSFTFKLKNKKKQYPHKNKSILVPLVELIKAPPPPPKKMLKKKFPTCDMACGVDILNKSPNITTNIEDDDDP